MDPKPRTFAAPAWVFAVVLLAGCGDDTGGYFNPYGTGDPMSDAGDPVNSSGDVSDPVYLESAVFGIFEGGGFPASLAHLYGQWEQDGEVLIHLANNIVLTNPAASAATVFVEVEIPGYSQVATQRVDLDPFETREIESMTPTFNYGALYDVVTPVNASAEVSIQQRDVLVDVRTASIDIEPINRIHWRMSSGDRVIDLRPFIVTLVTPADSGNRIQQLIRDAADFTESGAMVGYQAGTPERTWEQARAIYLALQNYYSVVYTSVAGSFFDQAQHVRLPAESLETESANCIDGALVFASAFEALGMEPILVFMSGHALVAVKAVPGGDSSQWIPIETTLLGSDSFEDAVRVGIARTNDAIENEDPAFAAFDVVRLRELGITPANL